MQPEISEILSIDPITSLPVRGFFENYPIEQSIIHNKSAILAGTSDYLWAYLCINESNDLDTLLGKFDFQTLYFANVEEWMLPHLTVNRRVEWKLLTNRYYLPADITPEDTPLDTLSLDHTLVGYIYQNSAYKDFTSEQYIADRLARDVSAGIWIDGQLAAWGLTHDDGSLGFLNVIPEFRGKGLGEATFRALIKSKKEQNKPVFVNIEPKNKQTANLLEKIGLEFDRTVSWIKLS